MDNKEIALAVLQLHQTQLAERRQKIHSITERTVGAFLLLSGWLVTSDPPSLLVQWTLTIVVVVIAGTSSHMIVSNNLSYLQVARVVRRLNDVLLFFKPSTYLDDKTLYPESWKNFGNKPPWKIAWYHVLPVNSVAALALAAVWGRQCAAV